MELTDRTCGLCGEANIPRSFDWPWWVDGQPVHPPCASPKVKTMLTVEGPNVGNVRVISRVDGQGNTRSRVEWEES